MKQLALVVGTILVFTAGVLTGRWYESRRPLPPPPAAFMGEFGGHRPGPGGPPSISRADFVAEIERLRPQIEDFRKHMDEIDDEFERGLEAILTPEQKALNAERLKRRAESRAEIEKGPLDEEHLMRLAQGPSMTLFRVVTLRMGYDSLNRALKFDGPQHDQVLALLRVRRDHFLAFLDSNPPPSLMLLPLAHYVQRAPDPPPRPNLQP